MPGAINGLKVSGAYLVAAQRTPLSRRRLDGTAACPAQHPQQVG
jgi:hypothetical protein